jgi:hypothetical protein
MGRKDRLNFREPKPGEFDVEQPPKKEEESSFAEQLLRVLSPGKVSPLMIKERPKMGPLKEVPPTDVTGGPGDSVKGEITDEDKEILRRLMEGKR